MPAIYTVYILWSDKLVKYYIGQTSDLEQRLRRHNKGWEKSTKSGVPWELKWSCVKHSLTEARELERKLKNLSQKRLNEFINKYSEGVVGH